MKTTKRMGSRPCAIRRTNREQDPEEMGFQGRWEAKAHGAILKNDVSLLTQRCPRQIEERAKQPLWLCHTA